MFYTEQDDFLVAADPVAAFGAQGSGVPDRLTGILAGTLLESSRGWRPVETLGAGDRVQTYDGGLRRIREMSIVHAAAGGSLAGGAGLVQLPGGVLNNGRTLTLLPDQLILIESRHADDLFGHPAVLIEAAALEALAGVVRVPAPQVIRAFVPSFDEEEILWANDGLLLQCTARPGRAQARSACFFPRIEGFDALELLHAISGAGCDGRARGLRLVA